jgi:uncharacterized protein
MPRRLMLAGFIVFSVGCASGAGPGVAQSAPDPAIAAARELIVTMRLSDQIKLILPPIVQSIRLAIGQGRPEINRDLDAILPSLLDQTSARIDEWVDQIATIYSRNFTPDEMRQVTTFYQSAAGQTFLAKMPTIMQESMSLGQTFERDVTGELRNRIIEELRKRGHNI